MGSESWGIQVPGGWYDDARHIYRDERGTIVPSTTGVFEILGCSDFSMIPPQTLEWKRTYGTAVHRAVELLAFKKLDWESCDEKIIPAVTGLEQRLKSFQYEPIIAEEIRIHSFNGMKVGMTSDHRGTLVYKGVRRPVIIDIKTGSKASSTWNWQVGGYVGGAPKPVGGSYIGLILQVDMDGFVNPIWVVDTLKAQREFVMLLAAAYLKLNAGLAKIKNTEEE